MLVLIEINLCSLTGNSIIPGDKMDTDKMGNITSQWEVIVGLSPALFPIVQQDCSPNIGLSQT